MNDTMMRVLEDGKKWALWGGCGSYEFGFELIDIGSPEPWSRGHRNSAAKRRSEVLRVLRTQFTF